MYKKIKNSSFMNLIWFIIAIIPIFILTIYSISYLNQKENNYNNLEYNNLINNGTNNNYGEYISQKNIFLYNNKTNTQNRMNLQLNTITFEANKTYYFVYVNNYNNYSNEYLSLYGTGINPNETNTNAKLIENRKTTLYFENEITINLSIRTSTGGYQSTLTNNKYYAFYITTEEINYSEEQLKEYSFNIDAYNIKADYFTNNYTYYLNAFKNSITSNGFISNAFLNLSQYFGVTNVYYSLACYYIEYLLVIVLLHLAFDVLYILPNICHKFMEKIGGERD